jgi:transcriptional regulator with XRE-family HTH domain
MRVQGLVAWNLRRLRVERGLSQENLAVDAGIDRTYVSRLERGLENPTVGILEQLSAALMPRSSSSSPSQIWVNRRPEPYRVADAPGVNLVRVDRTTLRLARAKKPVVV